MDQSFASAQPASYQNLVKLLRAKVFNFQKFKTRFQYIKSISLFFDINYPIQSSTRPNCKRTLLHDAVIFNHKDAVRFLLNNGADPNSVCLGVDDNAGKTPLHFAVYKHNQIPIAKLLIKRGASINAAQSDNAGIRAGRTPLLIAIQNNNSEMVKILLNHGAAVEAGTTENQTKLSIYSPLESAVIAENPFIVRQLLEHQANPDARFHGCYNRTALHEAALRGNEDIVRLLLHFKADPNVSQSSSKKTVYAGATPLHFAIIYNFPVIASLLLHCGANPNARLAQTDKTHPGVTPLFFALTNDKASIFNLLIEYGASWNVVLASPFVEYEPASLWSIIQGATPLHFAASLGELTTMQRLLEIGAPANSYYLCSGNGKTPLYFAVKFHQHEAVRLLLEWKADPDQCLYDASGKPKLSACHLAASDAIVNDSELLEILLDWGANPNLRCNTFWEYMPLDYSINSLVKTRCLIRYGADPFLTETGMIFFTKNVQSLINTYKKLLLIPSFRQCDQFIAISSQWLVIYQRLVGFDFFPSLQQLALWSLLISKPSDLQFENQRPQKSLPMSRMSELNYMFFQSKTLFELSQKYQQPKNLDNFDDLIILN